MKFKSFFNWSGGKDSALALYYALNNNNYKIERLITNINTKSQRVSMHGVREELLDAQAKAIGLPLQKLKLPDNPSMTEYETYMMQMMTGLQKQNFTHAFFGDIFLEDLKHYREEQLKRIKLEGVFPLWKRNTTELINEFIDLGFKTIIVCVKDELLDKCFAGRIIDKDFLKDLPKNVDVCGENGEFHTFVFDGPIFKEPITFTIGEKVFREYQAPKDNTNICYANQPLKASSMGFWFCDLLI